MNTIQKKRQFLKEVISGKKQIKNFNFETFETKKLRLVMLSNDDLQWLVYLYEKYRLQVKNDMLNRSVLSSEDLAKYSKIEKQFIYN